MKKRDLLNSVQLAFSQLADEIPIIKGVSFDSNPESEAVYQPDLMIELDGVGRLIIEAKVMLQPRHMHGVAMQLKQYTASRNAYSCVVAPYISEKTADVCKKYDIGYLDLLGNCRLSFNNIYIEKSSCEKVSAEKRELRSLFSIKSSRILHLMLNHVLSAWRVQALAEQANVSLGQVSNVRKRLLDLEYASDQMLDTGDKKKGLKLTQPAVLLHDWQSVYKKHVVQKQGYYCLLNADERLVAIREAMSEARDSAANILLSGFSAANWLAPFAKSNTESFYADAAGEEILIKHLQLNKTEKGANVIIEQPKDAFIFSQVEECAEGLWCTSLIQTYLDLSVSGERGKEAATHLETTKLWSGNNAGTG